MRRIDKVRALRGRCSPPVIRVMLNELLSDHRVLKGTYIAKQLGMADSNYYFMIRQGVTAEEALMILEVVEEWTKGFKKKVHEFCKNGDVK